MLFDEDEEVGDPGVDVQQQLRGELGGLSTAVAEVGGSSPSKLLKRWRKREGRSSREVKQVFRLETSRRISQIQR